MLYFVPITQATFVARAWTFPVAAAAVTGFGFLLNQTAATLRPHLNHAHHSHFFDHVQGMAIALAVSGVFVTVFVRRIAQELSLRNKAIERLSQKRSEERIAIALGALAAGAGHELGSPLGSIQLLVEELPHLRSDEQADAISTIVGEVQRMKKIVHSMSASQLSADVVQSDPWPLSLLGEDVKSLGVHLKTSSDVSTTQPRSVLAQILRELIRNAYSAKSDAHVTVEFELKTAALGIAVTDDGPGMSAEDLAHACEPFVSHAKSTGLGLFLAKVHVEQLGGQLELTSEPGQGTKAALLLPIHPPLSPLRNG
jgi:two-component system sensor histidine kinase RegB